MDFIKELMFIVLSETHITEEIKSFLCNTIKSVQMYCWQIEHKFPDIFLDVDEDRVIIADGTLSLFFETKIAQ